MYTLAPSSCNMFPHETPLLSLCLFPPSLSIMNSINVPLCSEFCLMKPTDSICCTSILLLLTGHLLVVFMSMFSVYSMFYHDGVCLSCVSGSKRFTYLHLHVTDCDRLDTMQRTVVNWLSLAVFQITPLKCI